MKTKVFIVDDHYMVIEGISSFLQQDKHVELIGHAMNADSCLSFLKNQQPDVVLMDINLPDKSGIELCKEVKELYPAIFILGLSTFNQQRFVSEMMNNGASGYVIKNASGDELLDAIRVVARGETYMSFDAAQVLRSGPESEIEITRRELDVLSLIADGMTNNEIAQKLFVSSSTVDTHRTNLLAKFSARNTAELVKLAFQLQFLKG